LAYIELHKYEKAIEDYNKTIELNPQKANAYVKRAFCYLQIGLKPALIDLHKAGIIYQEQNQIDDYNEVQDMLNTLNFLKG